MCSVFSTFKRLSRLVPLYDGRLFAPFSSETVWISFEHLSYVATQCFRTVKAKVSFQVLTFLLTSQENAYSRQSISFPEDTNLWRFLNVASVTKLRMKAVSVVVDM